MDGWIQDGLDTVLHRAALEGHNEVIEYILDSLTSLQQSQLLSVKDIDNMTGADYAVSEGYQKIVELINNRTRQLKRETKRESQQMIDIKFQFSQLQNPNTHLQTELTAQDEMIRQMEREQAAMREALDANTREIHELRCATNAKIAEFQDMKPQIKELEMVVGRMKADENYIQARGEDSGGRVAALEKMVESLQISVDDIDRDVEMMLPRLT